MPVITVLPDGRVLAYNSTTVTVPLGGGDQPITISFPEVKKVERVIQYKFLTDPITDPGTPVNEVITGRVVGVTMAGIPTGTTLTVEATIIGW